MDYNSFISKRKWYEIDPRIKFFIGFLGGILMLFIEDEISLFIIFSLAIVYCIYCGKWKNSLTFAIIYGLLFWWYLSLISSPEVNGIIVPVILFRRFLLIGAFITPLFTTDIGVLVASMHKMKLPRFIIISMAIMFRFFPTLQEEYRSVRTSQKFRAIGRSIINVILHPITFYETLIVPLAIRIMRISDELSASAMLRGADRKGNGTCFRDVKITFFDFLVLIIFLLVFTVAIMINYDMLGVLL